MQRRLENVTHNSDSNQFNGNRHETTKVMIKADKHFKIAITNMLKKQRKIWKLLRKKDINKENGTFRGENTKC